MNNVRICQLVLEIPKRYRLVMLSLSSVLIFAGLCDITFFLDWHMRFVSSSGSLEAKVMVRYFHESTYPKAILNKAIVQYIF